MAKMSLPPKIRIMLVEDHALVRTGLACVVNAEPDMEIVAELEDGRRVVEKYRNCLPDVVVLDLRMPGMDGIGILEALRNEIASVRCLILSSYRGGDEITRAMSQGACGYVQKGTASEQLLEAIRTIHAGKRYFPREIVERMTDWVLSDLSIRELDTLRLMARGKTDKETAFLLGIEELTVKGHVSNIFTKLGATDRTEAIGYAVQRGIISGT